MGKHKEAGKVFAAVKDEPGFAQPALNNIGNMLFVGGKMREAIKAYRKADKAGGKSEVICYNLGRAYLERGDLRDAAECFDEVLLLAPARLDVIELRASIAERLGKLEDAELYYRKILELRPADRGVVEKLIALLEGEERFEEAVKLVEDYLADFPTDPALRLERARLYRRMHWYEVAVMEYGKLEADTEFTDDYRVHLGLGKSLYDLIRHKDGRQYDKAIYHLKEAARLAPSDPEPDMLIGTIYMDYKRYRELAMDHWNAALDKAHSDAQRRKVKKLMAGERE
jgi:tetratricopeptide (TPR) repeat protein